MDAEPGTCRTAMNPVADERNGPDLLHYGSMSAAATQDPRHAIGRSPDQLTLDERFALTGKYVAMEIYTPKDLPLRRIEAIGDSVAACIRVLKERGLDPKKFEFTRVTPPY